MFISVMAKKKVCTSADQPWMSSTPHLFVINTVGVIEMNKGAMVFHAVQHFNQVLELVCPI